MKKKQQTTRFLLISFYKKDPKISNEKQIFEKRIPKLIMNINKIFNFVYYLFIIIIIEF